MEMLMIEPGLKERVEAANLSLNLIRREMNKVLVGQHHLIESLLIGLFTKGHVLIEGVPGLAKTSAVMALAATVHADFKRIQFTPDLLPADLIGTEVYLPKSGEFIIKKGPIFHNIILADEINRAPSKVQSALLEAMQERQVTIGGTTFPLSDPFLVLATQNPIEQEGTYPLPEAQVDRFMLKVVLDYPDKTEEKQIMNRVGFENRHEVDPVIDTEQIDDIVKLAREIYMDDKLKNYIVDLVYATRNPKDYKIEISHYIQYGASPRATIFLSMAARAYAFLQGRAFVTPQDIKTVAPDIFRHRIILSYEAEAEDITTEQIIQQVFDAVEVP
jgi:MoxR-like ATPase